jgi:hypothetical protein
MPASLPPLRALRRSRRLWSLLSALITVVSDSTLVARLGVGSPGEVRVRVGVRVRVAVVFKGGGR